MYFPTDLLFFGISLTDLLFFGLLYYYINLSLSVFFSDFSRDIYLFFFLGWGVFLCFTFDCLWTILWSTSWDFCNFISNLLLFPLFFELNFRSSLSASVLEFWYDQEVSGFVHSVFTYIFTNIFSKRRISITFYNYSISRFRWITPHLVSYILINNKVMF